MFYRENVIRCANHCCCKTETLNFKVFVDRTNCLQAQVVVGNCNNVVFSVVYEFLSYDVLSCRGMYPIIIMFILLLCYLF